MKPLTKTVIKKLIKTVDAGLCSGLGSPAPGKMCVEAAVCYALGLPHGDNPKCVSPAIRALKIGLNDAYWSSNKARAVGMRRLAVLQLGTDTDFDNLEFAERVVIMTVQTTLANLMQTINSEIAQKCREADTLLKAQEVTKDAANAAKYAANAAKYAANAAKYAANAAEYAANAAKYAANAAKYAAKYAAGDQVLLDFAHGVEEILIDMKVPAVKYLSLLD